MRTFSQKLLNEVKITGWIILLLTIFSVAKGQDYEAVGTLESRSYLGTNIFSECIYDFQFSISDCQWFLHAKIPLLTHRFEGCGEKKVGLRVWALPQGKA